MEIILDFLKEVLKGTIRAISARILQKTILENKKTTRSRQKQKGGSQNK